MEIKYNLNVYPYYDTTLDELNKNYIQYLAVEGQRLQNRELNVAQGLIRGNMRKITDNILEDGSIVSGCNFVRDNVNKICTLYSGEVYVNGVIIDINETQWTYSQVPEEDAIVYADILPIIITETDDPSLYNPAENYESFNDPGGHRLKYEANVGIVKEKDFGELLADNKTIVTLIKLKERDSYGPVKSKPLFSKINNQMNQRTYDSSGDFIAEGLTVTTLRHSDDPINKYNVHISRGRCYVKGEMYIITDTNIIVDNNSINVDSTLNTGITEDHIYTTINDNYYLNHRFVKEVTNIFGNVVISGLAMVTVGLIDDLSPSGYVKEKIVDIDKIYTNTPNITYIKKNESNALSGVYDYEVIGTKIVWNTVTPVNPKPNGTFYVDFIYNKNLTNLTDYYLLEDEHGFYIKFLPSNNVLKAGLAFKVNYSWYMPRIDLVYISNIGIPTVKNGLASDETVLSEPVLPAGSLPLCVIYVIPNTEPYNYYLKQHNLYRVPVGQLQNIKKRVDNLEYNVVMSDLETILQSKHLSMDTNGSYTLRNIYSDPIIDYSRADISSEDFSATVDIFRNAVYLPMEINQIGYDKADFTLAYNIGDNTVYEKLDPNTTSVVSLKDSGEMIVTSSQAHATHDIDITPFYYKGLMPTLECEPNKLVYVEDDPSTTVIWLPNRVIYSQHYVDSLVKEETEVVNRITTGNRTVVNSIQDWKPGSPIVGWQATGQQETGKKDNIYKITGALETVTSSSVETVEVTQSAVKLISAPFMKAGQKVLVKGKDFSPNTEIRVYLDEKIVTAEFTNTRYNDYTPPITSPFINDKPIDPTFETYDSVVKRPWQWAYNYNYTTNLWRFWHPLYYGRGIEYYYRYYGYNSYGVYRLGSWYYRILGFHETPQPLAKAPDWCKFIARSPWFEDSVYQISDEEIKKEINNINKIDPTTNTEYVTKYSEAKVTIITDQNGDFEVEIAIPENTSTGTHTVTAETVMPENFDPDYYKEAVSSFTGESYLRHWDVTVYKRIVENVKQTIYRDVTTIKYVNEIGVNLVYKYIGWSHHNDGGSYDGMGPGGERGGRGGSDGCGADPLLQTFKISTDQYLVGIDLYFSRIVDVSDTVTQPWIAIREVENGVPSNKLLHFQNIDKSIIVDADDPVTGIKAIRPTFIKFTTPFYAEAGKTYAFSVGANQDGYHLYYSSIGNRDVSTGEAVLYQKQQSEDGVMMISSNNSVWTAMQDADIKYTLYRAEYTTDSDVTIYVHNVNSTLPNFSNLNLSLGSVIFENTNIEVYYTINSVDIYDANTRWIRMSLEEMISFNYSDIYNNGMNVSFKIVLSTNNSAMSPVININTFELFLAKYLTRGTYSQLSFDINY